LSAVIALEAYHDNEYGEQPLIPESEFEELQKEMLELAPDDIQGHLYGILKHVANTPSIKDKLERIIDENQSVVDEFIDPEELAREARNRRNNIAHGSVEGNPKELHILAKKLQLILEATLALKIGVSEEVLFNTLAARHRNIVDGPDLAY
jgi:hypothetical protein